MATRDKPAYKNKKLKRTLLEIQREKLENFRKALLYLKRKIKKHNNNKKPHKK